MKIIIRQNKTKETHNSSYFAKTAKNALKQDDRTQFVKLIKVLEKK